MHKINNETNPIIEGAPIQDISGLSRLREKRYIRDIGGDFRDSRLTSKLSHLAVGELALLPPNVSGVNIDVPAAEPYPQVKLTKIPGLEKGRENSRSQVQFGQLYIDSPHDKSITEQVAVKYIHPITAPREFFASRAVDQRFGAPVTYTPMGFTKLDDGRIGYVSRYRHDILSLDNILWNPSATTEQRIGAMAFAGLWLAQLHNLDIIHGDAQAKNIARDSLGNPHYIDLEGASDVTYGKLDSVTQRLLDVSNLFDPQTMHLPASPEEIATFVDAYSDTQTGYNKVDGMDIIDTIDSMQEQNR